MSRPNRIAANFSAKADRNSNVEIVDPTVPNSGRTRWLAM